VKWTKQPGAGPVMICETLDDAIQEMNVAGCVDCTESVKDGLIEDMKAQGTDPDEFFDWDDHLGDTYWHVIP
jgi:hypothetical protein